MCLSCRLKEGGAAPPKGWPSSGALSYFNVTACYRPGLPPVLKDLTFSLKPGTSCGVVGRTGTWPLSIGHVASCFRAVATVVLPVWHGWLDKGQFCSANTETMRHDHGSLGSQQCIGRPAALAAAEAKLQDVACMTTCAEVFRCCLIC